MVIHTVREDQFLSMQVVLGITQTIFWPDILVVATVVKVIVEADGEGDDWCPRTEWNGVESDDEEYECTDTYTEDCCGVESVWEDKCPPDFEEPDINEKRAEVGRYISRISWVVYCRFLLKVSQTYMIFTQHMTIKSLTLYHTFFYKNRNQDNDGDGDDNDDDDKDDKDDQDDQDDKDHDQDDKDNQDDNGGRQTELPQYATIELPGSQDNLAAVIQLISPSKQKGGDVVVDELVSGMKKMNVSLDKVNQRKPPTCSVCKKTGTGHNARTCPEGNEVKPP